MTERFAWAQQMHQCWRLDARRSAGSSPGTTAGCSSLLTLHLDTQRFDWYGEMDQLKSAPTNGYPWPLNKMSRLWMLLVPCNPVACKSLLSLTCAQFPSIFHNFPSCRMVACKCPHFHTRLAHFFRSSRLCRIFGAQLMGSRRSEWNGWNSVWVWI